MSGELPPVIAQMRADIASFLAKITEAQTKLAEFAAEAQETATKAAASSKAQIDASEAGATAAGKGAEAQTAAAAETSAAADTASKASLRVRAANLAASDAAVRAAAAQEKAAALAKAYADGEETSYAKVAKAAQAASSAQERASIKAGQAQKAAADDSKKGLSGFAKFGGYVTGAAVLAGAASVKMAADFQAQMTLLQTAGGETAAKMTTIRSGILSLAQSTGTSTSQLASGMYIVAKSMSSQGAAGQMEVLKAAAQGAKAENVDLATATNALTSVMMSYHIPAAQAVSVQNQLVAGAGMAKTTMADYAGALSTVIPVASAAGVNFSQVAGAIATLTQHGTSAQESTQELANTIRNLQAPNSVASKEMQQLGLNVNQVSKNLGKSGPGGGLTGTINEVTDAIGKKLGPSGLVVVDAFKKSQSATQDLQTEISKMPPQLQQLAKGFENGTTSYADYYKGIKGLGAAQYEMGMNFKSTLGQAQGFNDLLKSGNPQAQTFAAALKQIMGGATGMNTALMLGGDNMDYFQKATGKVSAAGKDAGKNISTWAATQKTFNVQLDQMRETAEVLAIKLGDELMPAVESVMHGISDSVGWLEKHRNVALALASAVGSVLAVAMLAFAVNTMSKFVNSVKDAGSALKTFASHFPGVSSAAKQTATDVETAATRQQTATETTATAAETSAAEQEAASEQVGAAAQTTASDVESAATEQESAYRSIGAAAQSGATEVEIAAAEVSAASETAASGVSSSAVRMEASYAAASTSAQGMASETASVGSAAKGLGGPLAIAATAIAGIGLSMKTSSDKVSQGWKQLVTGAQQWATTATQAFNPTAAQSLSQLNAQIVAAKGNLEDQYKAQMKSAAAQTGLGNAVVAQASVNAAYQAQLASLSAEQATYKANLDAVTQVFKVDQPTAMQDAQQAGLNLATASKTTVVNAFKAMGVQVKASSDATAAAAKTIPDKVNSALKTGLPKATQTMSQSGKDQGTALANALLPILTALGPQAQTAAIAVGSDIDAGLAAGINQNTGVISSAASAAAAAAINAAKSKLDSHSPSKVFITIGEDTVTGLAQGISKQTGLAVSATQAMVSKVMKAADDAVGSKVTGKQWQAIVNKATAAAQKAAATKGMAPYTNLTSALTAEGPGVQNATDNTTTATTVAGQQATVAADKAEQGHAYSLLKTAEAQLKAAKTAAQHTTAVHNLATAQKNYDTMVDNSAKAQQQLKTMQVDFANAVIESQVRVGDAVGAANAKLQEARNTLSADIAGTQQYFTDLAAVNQAQADVAQTNVDMANAQIEANVDLGSAVAVAQAHIQEIQNQLAIDVPNSLQYLQDMATLHQDQLDYTNALAQSTSTGSGSGGAAVGGMVGGIPSYLADRVSQNNLGAYLQPATAPTAPANLTIVVNPQGLMLGTAQQVATALANPLISELSAIQRRQGLPPSFGRNS